MGLSRHRHNTPPESPPLALCHHMPVRGGEEGRMPHHLVVRALLLRDQVGLPHMLPPRWSLCWTGLAWQQGRPFHLPLHLPGKGRPCLRGGRAGKKIGEEGRGASGGGKGGGLMQEGLKEDWRAGKQLEESLLMRVERGGKGKRLTIRRVRRM